MPRWTAVVLLMLPKLTYGQQMQGRVATRGYVHRLEAPRSSSGGEESGNRLGDTESVYVYITCLYLFDSPVQYMDRLATRSQFLPVS